MILFDLRCSRGHGFEAWFRDGVSFDRQIEEGEVVCPVCGDADVAKAMMAPALARRRDDAPVDAKQRAAKALALLRAAHHHVAQHFEHVGERFAEEARRIHDGEAERRAIYGEASLAEARTLVDDGIEVGVLPPLPPEDA